LIISVLANLLNYFIILFVVTIVNVDSVHIFASPINNNMTTQLLKVSEAKKGMVVYQVYVWNFHFNRERQPKHHRDEKGRSVYTPYEHDIYLISQWTIHSCGKKLLRLCDSQGMKGSKVSSSICGDDYGWITTSKELAYQLVNELRSIDQYSTEKFEILYERH
jgi:hypothetical protein